MQLNLPLFDLPDVLCEYDECRKVVPQPFYVVKHIGRMTEQLPFCNRAHAEAHAMKRMRQEGL